jgi:hypothetical protein
MGEAYIEKVRSSIWGAFMSRTAKRLGVALLCATALTSPARPQVLEGITIAQTALSMFPDPDVQGTEIASAIDMLNTMHGQLNSISHGIETITDLLQDQHIILSEMPNKIDDVKLVRHQIGVADEILHACQTLERKGATGNEIRNARKSLSDLRVHFAVDRNDLFLGSQLTAGAWIDAMVTEATVYRHLPGLNAEFKYVLSKYYAALVKLDDPAVAGGLEDMKTAVNEKRGKIREDLAKRFNTSDINLAEGNYVVYTANQFHDVNVINHYDDWYPTHNHDVAPRQIPVFTKEPHFDKAFSWSGHLTWDRSSGRKDLVKLGIDFISSQANKPIAKAESVGTADAAGLKAEEVKTTIRDQLKVYNHLTELLIQIEKLQGQAAIARALALSWDAKTAGQLRQQLQPLAGLDALKTAQDALFANEAEGSKRELAEARRKADAEFEDANQRISAVMREAERNKGKVAVQMFLKGAALTIETKTFVDRYVIEKNAVGAGTKEASSGSVRKAHESPKSTEPAHGGPADPASTPIEDPKAGPVSNERVEFILKRLGYEIDNIEDADSDRTSHADALMVELRRTLRAKRIDEFGDGPADTSVYDNVKTAIEIGKALEKGVSPWERAKLAASLLSPTEMSECAGQCSRLTKYNEQADELERKLLDKHLAHDPDMVRTWTHGGATPPRSEQRSEPSLDRP